MSVWRLTGLCAEGAAFALIVAIGAGCSSTRSSADRDCAIWGPAESRGPLGDATTGGAQGAVVGVVTGSVARGVVMGAARTVSACIQNYEGF